MGVVYTVDEFLIQQMLSLRWNDETSHLVIPFTGYTTITSNDVKDYKSIAVIITIDEGFLEIGSGCFASFDALTTLNLPNSIETFGNNVIIATQIREIHIPFCTFNLNPGNPFDGTKNTLKKVTIDPNQKYYKVIDDSLYTKDVKKLIIYPCAKEQKTFVIPSTVQIIGSTALETSKFLEVIVFPPSLHEIQSYFCYYLPNLTNLIFLYSEPSKEIAQERLTISTDRFVVGTPLTQSDFQWIYVPKPHRNYSFKTHHFICKTPLFCFLCFSR